MNLKKLGIALIAVVALSAVSASNALAADEVVTDPASWTTDGGTPAQNTPQNVVCSKTGVSANFAFHTTVGGSPLTVTATGVECPESVIENITVAGEHMAIFDGRIKFTGLSVSAPAGCSTPATNTTNPVRGDLLMGKGTAGQPSTKKGFLKLEPTTGTNLTSVEITGCAIEGKYPVKEFTYLEATDETESGDTETQEFAGNETTCAMSSLLWGVNPVCFTGEIAIKLTSGTAWGAEPN